MKYSRTESTGKVREGCVAAPASGWTFSSTLQAWVADIGTRVTGFDRLTTAERQIGSDLWWQAIDNKRVLFCATGATRKPNTTPLVFALLRGAEYSASGFSKDLYLPLGTNTTPENSDASNLSGFVGIEMVAYTCHADGILMEQSDGAKFLRRWNGTIWQGSQVQ